VVELLTEGFHLIFRKGEGEHGWSGKGLEEEGKPKRALRYQGKLTQKKEENIYMEGGGEKKNKKKVLFLLKRR